MSARFSPTAKRLVSTVAGSRGEVAREAARAAHEVRAALVDDRLAARPGSTTGSCSGRARRARCRRRSGPGARCASRARRRRSGRRPSRRPPGASAAAAGTASSTPTPGRRSAGRASPARSSERPLATRASSAPSAVARGARRRRGRRASPAATLDRRAGADEARAAADGRVGEHDVERGLRGLHGRSSSRNSPIAATTDCGSSSRNRWPPPSTTCTRASGSRPREDARVAQRDARVGVARDDQARLADAVQPRQARPAGRRVELVGVAERVRRPLQPRAGLLADRRRVARGAAAGDVREREGEQPRVVVARRRRQHQRRQRLRREPAEARGRSRTARAGARARARGGRAPARARRRTSSRARRRGRARARRAARARCGRGRASAAACSAAATCPPRGDRTRPAGARRRAA